MTPIPLTPETEQLARRIIWFEPPSLALADPIRFIAYALEHATADDIALLRHHVPEADLDEALQAAPPGIIRPRSWAYWHAKFGRYPAPPMPVRRIP